MRNIAPVIRRGRQRQRYVAAYVCSSVLFMTHVNNQLLFIYSYTVCVLFVASLSEQINGLLHGLMNPHSNVDGYMTPFQYDRLCLVRV